MNKRYPDFLVVGAARSGTTALHRLLKQHPQLFLPAVKEPCFFTFADDATEYRGGRFAFAVKEEAAYLQLFSGAGDDQCAGEISTPYLYMHSRTIAAIKRYVPHAEKVKIIMVLRHPVERTFSNYLWRKRDGREDENFENALAMEQERIRKGYSFDYFYASRSLYSEGVKAYQDAFENVKVFLYDDFRLRQAEVLREICDFLQVNPNFRFRKVVEINRSTSPKFPLINRWLTAELKWKFRFLNVLPTDFRDGLRNMLFKWNSSSDPEITMKQETRMSLLKKFEVDTDRLAQLISRDLSHWKV
jgi:hypothetical protein